MGLTLLGMVLGFGEGDLIHSGTESYAVDDGCINADFETYLESPLNSMNLGKNYLKVKCFFKIFKKLLERPITRADIYVKSNK